MQAPTAVTVALVPHAELRALVAAFPRVSTALWRETLITAAHRRTWITSLGRRDARGRLADLFCELYLRLSAVGLDDGNIILMPLRQFDLADLLGLSGVHINRVMQDLRGEKFVHLRGRRSEI